MGKRCDFDRIPRDYYPTPQAAIKPLLHHLSPATRFIEPCAGGGHLIDHLSAAGHIPVAAGDIEPQCHDIARGDALDIVLEQGHGAVFITNPPWSRPVLHELIEHLSDQAPTWLLFDADWAHTRQAVPYLKRLRRIVSVGRLKWIEGSKFTGKENACWFLFERPGNAPAEFYGRTGA